MDKKKYTIRTTYKSTADIIVRAESDEEAIQKVSYDIKNMDFWNNTRSSDICTKIINIEKE